VGNSNERALYEAIHAYNVETVQTLIYQTGVDPNTNLKPFLEAKNLPETVLALKECLNKISSPPVSQVGGVRGLLEIKYTPEERQLMRENGEKIMKFLIEKGSKVDKDDILLVLEGYAPITKKRPAWDSRERTVDDPNLEHLRLLISGQGGAEALNQVREQFNDWEVEVREKDQNDHRWQFNIKLKQKEILDQLKQGEVTVSQDTVAPAPPSELKKIGMSDSESGSEKGPDKIFAL